MDKDLLDKQDLILAMQSRHLKRLRRKFKDVDNLMDKAHLLLEFAGEEGDFDIEDPVNLTPGEYEQIIKTVEQGVIKSIEKIIEINSEK
jgi:protein-tyrosine-phosphatase